MLGSVGNLLSVREGVGSDALISGENGVLNKRHTNPATLTTPIFTVIPITATTGAIRAVHHAANYGFCLW